jgi:hypothetical protein
MLGELKEGDSLGGCVREQHYVIPSEIASIFVDLVVLHVLYRYRKLVHPIDPSIVCNRQR